MALIQKRITAFIIIAALMLTILLLRLGYVQINKGEAYIERAYDLWTRNIPVSARRGRIFDCNGKLIVGNTISPTVSIIPNQVKDKEKTINQLATLLKVPTSKIKDHFYKNVSVEIIKPEGKNIDIDIAKKVIAADLPGVYVSGDVVRYYPYGNVLSHVLGIVGVDNQGITGIEYIYNDYLIGNLGSQNIFTDAHGNKIEGFTGDYTNPDGGLDIYLTINIDIQITLERLLDNATANYDSKETFGIVMNPNTSEILAMASRPNFELDNYQKYNQEDYNRNLPIWYSFEPGSTFKIVTYSAGLEEGVFSPSERFYDPGYVVVDGARIRDWKAGGHGDQSFLEVIQNSCNPGFVEIGRRLGKDKLFEYIRNFGFGSKTGIDLLGEGTGIVFNLERIGNVELATSSFGQGNSVTAIQLVNAASAAVNGGYLYKPHVLKGFGINNTQIFQYSRHLIRSVISEKTSNIVRDALERVVSLGTARSAYIEGYRVGGKTGTAQIAQNGQYLPNSYILSFLGIAPMNAPEVTAYIAIKEPNNYIQYGGVVVAPIVKELIFESLTILSVEKQEGGIPRDSRWWVDSFRYQVDNYVGRRVTKFYHPNYKIKVIGNGDTIVAQIPEAGEVIVQDNYVYVYTN